MPNLTPKQKLMRSVKKISNVNKMKKLSLNNNVSNIVSSYSDSVAGVVNNNKRMSLNSNNNNRNKRKVYLYIFI